MRGGGGDNQMIDHELQVENKKNYLEPCSILCLRYKPYAANPDAMITNTITQVSSGQLPSGSVSVQGRVSCAIAFTILIRNNTTTQNPAFNFMEYNLLITNIHFYFYVPNST